MASIIPPKITLTSQEVAYAIKDYIDSREKLYKLPGYEVDLESIQVSENQRGGFESVTVSMKPKT